MNKLSIPLLAILTGCNFAIMPLPGRPLRIEGEQVTASAHPSLSSDWAQGLRPDASRLEKAARKALAELWLQDARGEHASIPAFSKISLQLAALGAPPELLVRAHQAAIEEIGHARLCFALAEGYSGSSYSVEPIPEMLQLELSGTTLSLMAEETLFDGCVMEGFFAELASRAAQTAEEPAVKAALAQIAREEKSHAEFSWEILEWLLKEDPETVKSIVQNGINQLSSYNRPKAPAISHTDPELLMQHGRLPDRLWSEIWDRHTLKTQKELSPARNCKRRRKFPMTTPFLGTVGQHPSGLTEAYFRSGETCAICYAAGEDGTAGWVPESCTPFSTSAANACTRIYQECARIFPSLRPNAHGTQTRHIFHAECLRPWLKNNSNCPICRNSIHPEAMLTTAQKLRLEMGRHPKIWGTIGGFCAAVGAELTAKRLGMDRNVVKWLAYGTGFAVYQGLRRILAIPNPIRHAARPE